MEPNKIRFNSYHPMLVFNVLLECFVIIKISGANFTLLSFYALVNGFYMTLQTVLS